MLAQGGFRAGEGSQAVHRLAGHRQAGTLRSGQTGTLRSGQTGTLRSGQAGTLRSGQAGTLRRGSAPGPAAQDLGGETVPPGDLRVVPGG
jgi:hypothetical protein